MSRINEIAGLVEAGKSKEIAAVIETALKEGCDPMQILNDGMLSAMAIVGEKFQKNEIFVPEMLIAARAMKKGVEVLKPQLAAGATSRMGKCIIGTVHGDLHDIGKNLVSMMIESAGFQMIDLGVDVTKETFIETIKQNSDAKVIALSALLTTTMPSMQEIATAIRASSEIKIMVGGAPVTQDFANQIGADGYSADAAGAAEVAKRLAA
jgi:5-methyltetrahydrofolate--homocysteine methyltransferase